MVITVKNIIPRKFAENSQTAQYTASGCKTVVLQVGKLHDFDCI